MPRAQGRTSGGSRDKSPLIRQASPSDVVDEGAREVFGPAPPPQLIDYCSPIRNRKSVNIIDEEEPPRKVLILDYNNNA